MGNNSPGAQRWRARRAAQMKAQESWRGILKLQRPVVSTDPNPKLLICNEDRSILTEQPVTKKLLALFGDDFKIYCEAHFGPGGMLLLDDIVPPARWPNW